MAGLIVYIVAFALSIIIPAAIRVSIHGLKLLIIFLNTLFAFGVATEVKTVVGIKTNYQE
jgi:flagellar motor component MotA